MLKTKRLTLRKFNKSDINDFYNIFSNKDVVKYLPIEPLDKSKAEIKLKNIIEDFDNNDLSIPKQLLAIELSDKNKVIGWVGFSPIPFDNEKIELFYALGKKYWGNGFAYEAAYKTLKYIKKNFELKNVYAIVDSNNIASVNLLKKLGFKYFEKIADLDQKYSFFNNLCLFINNRKTK